MPQAPTRNASGRRFSLTRIANPKECFSGQQDNNRGGAARCRSQNLKRNSGAPKQQLCLDGRDVSGEKGGARQGGLCASFYGARHYMAMKAVGNEMCAGPLVTHQVITHDSWRRTLPKASDSPCASAKVAPPTTVLRGSHRTCQVPGSTTIAPG